MAKAGKSPGSKNSTQGATGKLNLTVEGLTKSVASNIEQSPPVDVSEAEKQGANELEADQIKAQNIKTLELANTLKQQQIELVILEHTIATENKDQRKTYATYIFRFTCAWAIVMLLITILVGFGLINHISDKVLITLITSTTVNFFGFFLLVVKYLFNTGNTNNIKSDEAREKKIRKSKKNNY